MQVVSLSRLEIASSSIAPARERHMLDIATRPWRKAVVTSPAASPRLLGAMQPISYAMVSSVLTPVLS